MPASVIITIAVVCIALLMTITWHLTGRRMK